MSGLSEALLPVVHEYVLYSEMLMAVMKRRDQIQAEALTSKKADTDLLTEEIGKLQDKVDCADNALKAYWERWKQNMQNDIKSAFTNMAEENILYYEQVISDMQYFFLVLFKKLSSLLLSVYLVLKESVQEPSVTFKVLSGGSVPVELPVNRASLNPPTNTKCLPVRR